MSGSRTKAWIVVALLLVVSIVVSQRRPAVVTAVVWDDVCWTMTFLPRILHETFLPPAELAVFLPPVGFSLGVPPDTTLKTSFFRHHIESKSLFLQHQIKQFLTSHRNEAVLDMSLGSTTILTYSATRVPH